jgi:hypothetical protein
MSIPSTSRPIVHLGAIEPFMVLVADAGFVLALDFAAAAIVHVKISRGMNEVK